MPTSKDYTRPLKIIKKWQQTMSATLLNKSQYMSEYFSDKIFAILSSD